MRIVFFDFKGNSQCWSWCSYKTSCQTASRDCMHASNVFLNSTSSTTTLDSTVCMLACNVFLNSTPGMLQLFNIKIRLHCAQQHFYNTCLHCVKFISIFQSAFFSNTNETCCKMCLRLHCLLQVNIKKDQQWNVCQVAQPVAIFNIGPNLHSNISHPLWLAHDSVYQK